MEKVYTLRVVVELFDDSEGVLSVDRMQQVRTQELTGDLGELQAMAMAVSPMAQAMTWTVLGAEQKRQAVSADGDGLPY